MYRSVLAVGGLTALAALLFCMAEDSADEAPGAPDLPPPSCEPAGVVRFEVSSLSVRGESIRVSARITTAHGLEEVSIRLGRGPEEVNLIELTSLGSGSSVEVRSSTTLPGLAADRIELRVHAALSGSGEPTIAVQPLTDPPPDLRDSPDGAPLPEVRDLGGHSIEVPAMRSVEGKR